MEGIQSLIDKYPYPQTFRSDGEPCSLYSMVRNEPEWAVARIRTLHAQLAASQQRVGELEKELAERGKDIVFYSELRDSAVGSLEKLEREREELRREWNSFRPSLVDGRLLALYGAESHHAFPIIDRILGGPHA